MSFTDRMKLAEKLEANFIDAFNKHCDSHQIIKYGIESSKLVEAHEYVRGCHDDTSKFIRYIPDSVLVSNNSSKGDTTLIEFKAATTGIKSDSFFNRLRSQECPEMEPQFDTKKDVFNIESEALELYSKLVGIGVRVVIVVYAGFRSDYPLRAQFVQNIVKCNTWNPNKRGMNAGSGTFLSNVNLISFDQMASFFHNELGVNYSSVLETQNAVTKAFSN